MIRDGAHTVTLPAVLDAEGSVSAAEEERPHEEQPHEQPESHIQRVQPVPGRNAGRRRGRPLASRKAPRKRRKLSSKARAAISRAQKKTMGEGEGRKLIDEHRKHSSLLSKQR